MTLTSGHGERAGTIRADDLARHLNASRGADSRKLGWRHIRAEAYSFPCQHDDFCVPGVRDHFMIEAQTSRRPNDIERKMDGWQRRRWHIGDMAFYPCGRETVWRWHSPMNSVLFMFPVERWYQTAEEVFGCADRSVSLRPRFAPDDAALRQILLLLNDELHNESGNGALYADGLADAALARLLQHHSTRTLTAPQTAPGLSQRQLNRIVDLIECNLGEAITVDDMADAAGVGPCYFPRIFRQSTGHTPYKFVLQRRVERAQELLTGTDLSVVEIALAVGFSSQSHFTAAFHKATGITPAAYRRMN